MSGISSGSRLQFKIATLAVALSILGLMASAQRADAVVGSPVLHIKQHTEPTRLAPGGQGAYVITVANVGPVATTGPVSVAVTLPPGVTATGLLESGGGTRNERWECPDVVGASVIHCTVLIGNEEIWGPDIQPFQSSAKSLPIFVSVDSSVSGVGTAVATVSGGGAVASASASVETTFSSDAPPFSLSLFEGRLSNLDGSAAHQAGGHPDIFTDFELTTRLTPKGGAGAVRNLKDVKVELPPGLVGNPRALAACDPAGMITTDFSPHCPPESQVGFVEFSYILGKGTPMFTPQAPLYNVAPEGSPARFGFNILGVTTVLEASVRSSSDYGIDINVLKSSQSLTVAGFKTRFWGVPADPVHDQLRYYEDAGPGAPSAEPRRPFLTTPTECSADPLQMRMTVNSWQEPSVFATSSFDSDFQGDPWRMEGCNQLDFSPTIEARPTTNLADSPSGLDVKVHIPQNEDPNGLSAAHLKDATVTLPAGMSVNPSSANGLGACSPAQVGLTTPVGVTPAHFDEAPNACPDAAKLGTVQIDTPVLDHPMKGAIYLASQNENPFGSLLGLYIVVEDPKSGVTIKLAGHPVPDPKSGRLTVSFDQNPQLPFEDLRVNLFTGPRASLKTPMACGSFTTTSTLVPWSGPEGADATPSDTFAITDGANNSPCLKSEAEAPNKPSFAAGTADPAAGAYSPFVLKVVREDGTQPLKAIDATLPKGLLGKLAGIPYCSDGALAAAAGKTGRAEQASSSCPVASRVGSVTVGAGAGSSPLYVGGNAYLAGPYKGSPLSLAIVTPAVAGPFDLGTVVVRNKLDVDPETAQIHAVSDEIPTILQGIPLDIRSIAVSMDRPEFILNPTSCDPTTITAGATSVFNQTASLSSRFQVGGCNALGFKPQLAIDLKGATKRAQYPALRATLKARPGDANLGKAVVTLPHSEFLAQNHIKTICTRVQFAANACPPGSVYGKARAFSPLLDKPVEGPVYLRSSSNKLPDLVADLNGQIRIALVGRIDSIKSGGIRTSFESVPDAPVSKFVLEMAGGKKGLLENSRNLCNSVNKADVKLDGQNGKAFESTPVVSNDCKVKKKHNRKGSHKRGARH